jgi:hypothetical protein
MASGALNPLIGYDPPQFNAPPNRWDYILLSGQQSPGYCKISGFKRGNKWDTKRGKGAQGQNQTYTNKPGAEGEITFYLWTATHFAQWESFRPLFLYDPTKTTTLQAVQIDHPSLADLGIKRVVTQDISPIYHDGAGLFYCVANLMEFDPPPPTSAVASPSAAKPNTPPGATPPASPQDPLQAQIADLWKQFQSK